MITRLTTRPSSKRRSPCSLPCAQTSDPSIVPATPTYQPASAASWTANRRAGFFGGFVLGPTAFGGIADHAGYGSSSPPPPAVSPLPPCPPFPPEPAPPAPSLPAPAPPD